MTIVINTSSSLDLPWGNTYQCPFCDYNKILTISCFDLEIGIATETQITLSAYCSNRNSYINNTKVIYKIIDCYCEKCYLSFSHTAGF